MNDKESHGTTVLQSAYATLTRPTTAAMVKMLSKITPLYSRSGTLKKWRASDLQKLIEKVHKHQKKVDMTNKALLKAFDLWGAELPNPENALVVREFSELLDCVNVVYSAQGDRLNILKVHLGAIATREARQKDLLEKHNHLQRKFDATAMKHGPKAAQTSLFLDQIEENEYNLKLIEQQLMRIASSSLREACTEYLLWLQGSIVNMTRSCNAFAATLRDTDPNYYRRLERMSSPTSGVSRIATGEKEIGRDFRDSAREIARDIRDSSRSNLDKDERPLEIRSDHKKDLRTDMKSDVRGDGRSEMRGDLRSDIRADTRIDHRGELRSMEMKDPKDVDDWAAYDIRRYERNQEGWG
ncbi:CIC11C00000003809 [Sungouiella intermedia]|uniref:CIC11C00000003809 n=1 Tax=Sungouiella intermedia TaxID=45354 RepID=A0A1L0BLC0_9ASCO|nr:CIC11C00000003809 [[Candida] intermedia]